MVLRSRLLALFHFIIHRTRPISSVRGHHKSAGEDPFRTLNPAAHRRPVNSSPVKAY